MNNKVALGVCFHVGTLPRGAGEDAERSCADDRGRRGGGDPQ